MSKGEKSEMKKFGSHQLEESTLGWVLIRNKFLCHWDTEITDVAHYHSHSNYVLGTIIQQRRILMHKDFKSPASAYPALTPGNQVSNTGSNVQACYCLHGVSSLWITCMWSWKSK